MHEHVSIQIKHPVVISNSAARPCAVVALHQLPNKLFRRAGNVEKQRTEHFDFLGN